MNGTEMDIKDCRCPTCGAIQSWRDECRRCGTDLAELRLLDEETVTLRNAWAIAIRAGNYRRAVHLAERLRAISPTLLCELLYDYTRHLGDLSAQRFILEFMQ